MRSLEPPDVATLAAMLSSANADGMAILPRGGGTKRAWGPPASRVDAVLSTLGICQPIEHAAGDLIATVPAGATLSAVNAALGREGQVLPLDPPYGNDATIGGIVATNDSGPRRHRFGTPRDLIIGIELALADGRLAKAGGRVVKNVAGYDLGRLLCGSWGSLAVVTSATFKLSPVAPASRTVLAELTGLQQLGELVQAITEAPLTPSAVELETRSPLFRLMVRFESTEQAADRQAESAALLCRLHDATVTTLAGSDEATLWTRYEAALWSAPGTMLKLSMLPTDVPRALDDLDRFCKAHSSTYTAGGRAGLGVLFVLLNGDSAAQADTIGQLRAALAQRKGTAVIVSTGGSEPPADFWGTIGDALPLMRAVKSRFDPKSTLAPGRGPAGI
jgi:glycolate oxidase FAD binding subunit